VLATGDKLFSLEFSGIGSVPAQKSSLPTKAQQAVDRVSVTKVDLVILDGAVRDHRIPTRNSKFQRSLAGGSSTRPEAPQSAFAPDDAFS
jgi:hypothetical protein